MAQKMKLYFSAIIQIPRPLTPQEKFDCLKQNSWYEYRLGYLKYKSVVFYYTSITPSLVRYGLIITIEHIF